MKSRWNWRGMTSLLSLFGFFIMSITGIVLFIVPHGRIAYWTEWKLLGMTKEQWGDIHILSMFLFLASIGFHIYFNWKPLVGYFKKRATKGIHLKKELAVTLVVSLLIVAGGIWRLPPLSYILDVDACIKDAWVVEKDYEPPFGHAELLSLSTFCKKTNIPLDAAVGLLADAGWKGVSPDRTLVEIARENDRSPLDLYRVIKVLEVVPAGPDIKKFTAKSVEEAFAGTGIGNKSITEIAGQLGLPSEALLERLQRKGMQVGDGLSVKQIAQKNNLATPVEVLKSALVESYRPSTP